MAGAPVPVRKLEFGRKNIHKAVTVDKLPTYEVNPGSKAAQKGVREGDVISTINGQSTRNISNSDAHALLRNAGQTLHLGLNEECSGSPKRRLHRNIQDSKSESIKRSTVSKTTTTTTTSVSVNGAADSNCNIKISTKGDGHQGKQNGGLKENSSAPDSKGPRRRRRSTSLQPATSDVKEDSDAVGEDKTRRRRRSRGANRRKCRGGGESDVSGNEQKRASEDRDVSDTDARKKGSRRSSRNRKSCSVDRIKSDAEDKPKKLEQDAVAPKKARRRRSRTDKPEAAEAKIRFAIHVDAEQKMEVVVSMVDEAQKEVLAVRETAKTELSAPVVTDNVQMEVPITFDEVQTTELPVTVDGYQMEEVVSVDEIQTEVRVTVGEIETEVQTQVPITMDTYQLKEPVTEDEIETEVSIATNDVQTEVPIAMDDIQTEVPIETGDVQTEVPIKTGDVQTEVPIETGDVQTEVPIATSDVGTEVPIAMNDVQTEVPITLDEVPKSCNRSSYHNGDGLDKHSIGVEYPQAEAEMVEGDENQESAESNVHMRENVAEDVANTESVIDDQLPMQLLNENAIELKLQEASDVAGSPDDGSSEREEDERCLSQSSCVKETEEHECITVEVHLRSESETCEVGMEDIVSPECRKNSEAMLVSSELSNGDFNKETEMVKIENSYSEGAFFINVIESNDQCRAMDTDEVWEEVEEMSDAEVFYDASDRCVANLSAEERELLDPSPVMEAAEEETLRRFIHSLNLADYSKEAVTARNGGAEELFASRRDKRRTSLETYQGGYTQQRGLEVIVEENSSDYSDGEARKPRGWQEAVFIPETNEVVFVNNDDESSSSGQDSSSSRNSALFYPSRLKATEGIDVFSEDMENALENAVRVELADSSDEDVEVVEGSWERGVATERQDGVEIVFLDEDSGSTSSGFKQDDPEDFGKRDSGDFSDNSGVYENVEFVNQRMTVLRKKDYRRSVIESEDTCAVYENVVFVRRDFPQSSACPSSEERIIDDMDSVQENDKLTKENQNEIDVIGMVKESVDDTILVKENEKSPESTIPKENYNGADKSNTVKEMVDKGIVDNTISAKESEKSPEYAITKENKNKKDKINTVEELVEKKIVDYTDSAKENEKLTESTITKETQNKSDEINMVKEIVYDTISAKENGKSPESTIKKENQNETDKIKTVKEIVEKSIVDDTISAKENEKLTESTITKKNRNEIDNVDTFKEVIVKRIDNIASVQQVNNSQESIITKENKNETDKIDVINKEIVEVHEHDKLSECSVTNQSQNANELLSVEEKEVSGYFISVDAIEKDAASDSQSKHEDLDLESITPTNRSRRGSSSSDAGSHGTAFYCPGGFSPVSSDADVSSVTEDVENRTLRRRHLPKRQQEAKKCIPVRSLKELCVERVVSLPCGGDILRMLGLGKPPMPDPGGVDRQQPKPDPLWLGVPTKQDPNLLVCLSPSQRQSYGQGEAHTTPDNLLDLHRKFVARRGYHESAPAPPPRGRHCTTSTSSQDSEIGVAGVEGKGVSCSRSRSSSRLLALLRADLSPPSSASSESSSVASSPPPLPPPPHAYAMLHRRPSTICCTPNDLHTATLITNDDERLKVRSLSDWLQLVRCGGSPPVSACISTQSSPGSVRRAKDPRPASEQNGLKEHQILKQQILERRFSLPEKAPVLPTSAREDERHDQQLKLLHQRQQQRLRNQQQQQKPPLPKQQKLFDPDNYTISRRGDVAVINNGRPKSMPPGAESLVTGGELFRQQMYNEYMHKVAERAERRRQKVIRLSTAVAPPPRDTDAAPEALEAAVKLENEFMGKVRARMDKLGLKYDEDDEDSEGDGGHQLPKHLQEFLVIAGDSDSDGVWSPSQKAPSGPSELSYKDREAQEQKKREGDDAPPVVWTPKSAGASPTSERREFRPVNFESPKLQRKNRSGTSTPTPAQPPSAQEHTTTTTFSSIFPPWQQPLSLQQQHSRDDSTVSVGSTIQSPTSEKSVASSTISSTIDRRLVQSQSAPASGLSALAAGGSSSTKLPRAQNPTITLLQKAREGQLPRGALYLDHKMNSKEGDKAYISPNEVLYSVRKEYESDGDGDQRKKMVDLTPRKFEGIGPMTKDGIPIVLRSEVKDTNQAKWYKRMYDSLHRAGKDGHYPYIAPGGYLSEPEPALYDSDIGYSAKYATLDRRRIKNKENDFTTSTLPRSRYVPHPSSIKYATEVYKNQPGRIEDYEPGHSSISDKETKQWWDEVLDIFDGQASAEPKTTPTNKQPFMTYALKESGYESDSTLVFKRRDENLQSQLSPAEQKIAYKTIQKGGEVPLQGLRKPAPERPKEIEYFPISPHLTRIRVHKQNITPLREIVCYPVTATYTDVPPIFSSYKRTAPSYAQVVPRRMSVHPPPPSPPKRLSSRHSSTLRLWSKMKMPSQTPIRPRHESCFKETNVSFLRDRLSHKLEMNSRSDRMATRTASSSPLGTRTRAVAMQRSRSAPEAITKPGSSASEHRSRRSQQEAVRKLSRSPELAAPMEVRKILQKQKEKDVRERMGSRSLPPGTVVRSSTTMYSSARNAGRHCHPDDKALRVTVAISAKGRELLQPRTASHSPSTTATVATSPTGSLAYKTSSCSKSPSPVQRGRQRTDTMRSPSPCYQSPTSSSSSKSKTLTSPSPSLPGTPLKRTSRECMKAASSSLVLLAADEGNRRTKKGSSVDAKKKTKEKPVSTCPKSPLSVPKGSSEKEERDSNRKKGKRGKLDGNGNGESKRLQNSKKNGHLSKSSTCSKSKVNGEEKRKGKKTGSVPRVETMADLSVVAPSEDSPAVESTGPLNTESFFQHLLLRDVPSPTPSLSSSICRSSSILERARKFHEQISGHAPSRVHRTESTLGLLNVYLAQKRPVSDSKFRSLDRELSRSSRSPSPTYRSVTFPTHSQYKDGSSCHEADGGRFYSLGPSRSRTPDGTEGRFSKVRSSSEPPVLSSTTESVSLSRERPPIASRSQSPTVSPACKKIRGTRSQTVKTVESIVGPKRKGARARSAGDAEDVKQSLKQEVRTPPLSVAQSTSSLNLSHITDHGEYQSYVMELMHSTKKSERFRELHKFYSSLERLGELERTTSTGDLRPRLKGEEVIDYDRWMQLRKKEKAEQEMKILYRKLKEDQKEKDLLFQPKDAESLRWKSNRDRGLRCKERSVENLKYHFGKLSSEESDLEAVKRKELDAKKDVYKPLWRGSSVLNLATCLATVTGSRRGRPVLGDDDASASRHSSMRSGRGIWSSLSMDQVNALKCQLSEIYSTVSNLKREKFMKREDYEITVPPERGKSSKEKRRKDQEALHVRCNSLLSRDQLYSPVVRRRETRRTESMKADSISSLPHWRKNGSSKKAKSEVTRSFSDRVPAAKPMSETEKKRLSMTLSQEVLDRVTEKHRKTFAPVIRARETRGAIAAAAAKGKRKSPSPSTSPVLSETVSPRTCYSLEMSEEDASASRKNDFLLVLTPSGDTHEVQKAVEEWANSKPSTESERKTENGVLARLVRTTSASETESASSDASMRTVIHCADSKENIHHKVKYFEKKQVTSPEAPSSGRVSRSASDIRPPRHPALTCSSRAKSAPSAFSSALKSKETSPMIPPTPTKLQPSQSFSDLKELFGERSRLRYATVPLMTRRRQESASPPRSTSSLSRKTPEEQRGHQKSASPHRGYYSSSSTESLFHRRSRSTSPDPTKYWRAYLRMVKRGDVRRLRDKFESLEDIYCFSAREHDRKRNVFALKRYRSDPEIARNFLARRGTDTSRVIVRGQEVGDVGRLRRRYEACNRGRSRGRKTRALSPVLRIPFRAEDRFMPHINIISKTASLQSRSSTTSPHRQVGTLEDDDDSYTHLHTGEVQRIREKFESQLSLMGQMFTSTPDMHELRDIAPYLGCHWVAHKFPDTQPNGRSLSSPELRPAPPVPSQRPSSSSPTRSRRQPPPSILKPRQMPATTCAIASAGRDAFANQAFDPSIHRPLYRYQPSDSDSYSCHQKRAWPGWWWRHSPTNPALTSRPTVTFKEPVYGPVPPRSYSPRERAPPESPHRYVESEVTIHYRSPVRAEAKEALSEEELARRQAEAMRRIYQEERRRKYLQELQDMHSRRHTDNFTPSQKSPIPLNRYDDILDDVGNKGKSRDRTPEPKLVARALYNFVGQTSRELSFRRGDIIFVRRQIDKNWYEGEHNAMVGLFPFNYVEIIPYDGIRTIPKRPSEGQARAKFNFIAQTHLELSLVKGELVVLTRRVDDNWFEGRIGNRKGIFPVSYVEILSEPGEKPGTPTGPPTSKPITLPASHTVLMNGSGIKQSMGQHSYQPSSYYGPNKLTSSNPYATLPRQTLKQPLAPVNQTLHIDTHSEPVPYRALYNYRPQNEDELELCEGDTVYVMEKCDDGWYVGSSQRTGYFGTFPGNYVERI